MKIYYSLQNKNSVFGGWSKVLLTLKDPVFLVSYKFGQLDTRGGAESAHFGKKHFNFYFRPEYFVTICCELDFYEVKKYIIIFQKEWYILPTKLNII